MTSMHYGVEGNFYSVQGSGNKHITESVHIIVNIKIESRKWMRVQVWPSKPQPTDLLLEWPSLLKILPLKTTCSTYWGQVFKQETTVNIS